MGDGELRVTVIDSAGQPVAGANVTVALGDDQRVTHSATSDAAGSAAFSNLLARTLLVTAKAGQAFGVTVALLDVGSLTTVSVQILGFNAVSNIANNDFSQGQAGYAFSPLANMQILPHIEGPLSNTTATQFYSSGKVSQPTFAATLLAAHPSSNSAGSRRPIRSSGPL